MWGEDDPASSLGPRYKKWYGMTISYHKNLLETLAGFDESCILFLYCKTSYLIYLSSLDSREDSEFSGFLAWRWTKEDY